MAECLLAYGKDFRGEGGKGTVLFGASLLKGRRSREHHTATLAGDLDQEIVDLLKIYGCHFVSLLLSMFKMNEIYVRQGNEELCEWKERKIKVNVCTV